ncbi:hypothetical protein D3C72_1331350 [compost metagenome]
MRKARRRLPHLGHEACKNLIGTRRCQRIATVGAVLNAQRLLDQGLDPGRLVAHRERGIAGQHIGDGLAVFHHIAHRDDVLVGTGPAFRRARDIACALEIERQPLQQTTDLGTAACASRDQRQRLAVVARGLVRVALGKGQIAQLFHRLALQRLRHRAMARGLAIELTGQLQQLLTVGLHLRGLAQVVRNFHGVEQVCSQIGRIHCLGGLAQCNDLRAQRGGLLPVA